MSKKDKKQQPRIIKIHNSFQNPGVEIPIETDLSSKRLREEIVHKFLEEREKNEKS